MDQAVVVHPWDDREMTDRLVEAVQRLPRVPLSEVAAPATPGAYLQFVAAPQLAPLLGSTVATGRYPAYVGVAMRSLRERVGRYRQSIAGLTELDDAELFVALVPCASSASAAFAERALIEALQPALNGSGWGAKRPGARRAGRCSPVDAVLRGRRWAAMATPLDTARARLQLLSAQLRMDPDGPRWEPLVAGTERSAQ